MELWLAVGLAFLLALLSIFLTYRFGRRKVDENLRE